MICFLSALGKCPIEVLPCLDRIAEFVDQQAHSKQATTIIQQILSRIPERLIRARFESDNTESGFASVAMTLLKVTLKTNGHHFDEAKRIVNIVLGTSDNNLHLNTALIQSLLTRGDRLSVNHCDHLDQLINIVRIFT